MESLQAQLRQILENIVTSVTSLAPRVLLALVLIVALWITVRVIEIVLRAVLRRVHFDALLERAGVSPMLQKIGIAQAPSEFLPRIARWLLVFLFVQAAADTLGLVAISNAIGGFLAFLPNLLSAVLLLFAGALAAQFAGGAVARSARESGIEFAGTLGNLVSALIVFIAGIMAISQLRIDTEIVRIVSACLLAGVALALGLSFGLGSREITRNLLAGFYAKRTFRVGDPIEIRGERGVLRAITAVQTLIEADGRTIAIANSAFLDEVARS